MAAALLSQSDPLWGIPTVIPAFTKALLFIDGCEIVFAIGRGIIWAEDLLLFCHLADLELSGLNFLNYESQITLVIGRLSKAIGVKSLLSHPKGEDCDLVNKVR